MGTGWRELHRLSPGHRPCAGTGTPRLMLHWRLARGNAAAPLLALWDQILEDFSEHQNSLWQAEALPVSSASPHAVSPAELRARSCRPVPSLAWSPSPPVSGAVLSRLRWDLQAQSKAPH